VGGGGDRRSKLVLNERRFFNTNISRSAITIREKSGPRSRLLVHKGAFDVIATVLSLRLPLLLMETIVLLSLQLTRKQIRSGLLIRSDALYGV
jgi:hypothetical protein